jgi:hypothetical protein
MPELLRIGAGAGFAGDRLQPAAVLAERGDIRYLLLECRRTHGGAGAGAGADPTRGYDPLLERRRAVAAAAAPPRRVSSRTWARRTDRRRRRDRRHRASASDADPRGGPHRR